VPKPVPATPASVPKPATKPTMNPMVKAEDKKPDPKGSPVPLAPGAWTPQADLDKIDAAIKALEAAAKNLETTCSSVGEGIKKNPGAAQYKAKDPKTYKAIMKLIKKAKSIKKDLLEKIKKYHEKRVKVKLPTSPAPNAKPNYVPKARNFMEKIGDNLKKSVETTNKKFSDFFSKKKQ